MIKEPSHFATHAAILGSLRPETSFMQVAPHERASSAMLALCVSMEIVISRLSRIFFRAGKSLSRSLASLTGGEPGAVETAPRSIISAPSAFIPSAMERTSLEQATEPL